MKPPLLPPSHLHAQAAHPHGKGRGRPVGTVKSLGIEEKRRVLLLPSLRVMSLDVREEKEVNFAFLTGPISPLGKGL